MIASLNHPHICTIQDVGPNYLVMELVEGETIAARLDKAVTQLGVRVLRTPVRGPMANAFCERLGGSLRRECLDFLIPLNERHLRMIVKEWESTTTGGGLTARWAWHSGTQPGECSGE